MKRKNKKLSLRQRIEKDRKERGIKKKNEESKKEQKTEYFYLMPANLILINGGQIN